MKYRWLLRSEADPDATARLRKDLNDLPEALARALVLRGVETFEQARHFFRPSLAQLHDPFLMKDMEAAADRVAAAVRRRERVLVYGDYDVDGTTATALMTGFLHDQGVPADYFIPDRIEDGYGLSRRGVDFAVERGAGLIIALDCGITGHEEADYARQKGVDLVICDHHKALDTVPAAVAVLDPKRADCSYPFKELSGCGIGFKLIQATLARLGASPDEALPYLDLVAVSTASDIVPLEDENRILMVAGLERLRTAPRLGLRSIAAGAGLDLAGCTTRQIVFGLAPRINAAGRLGDACVAVELMLETDARKALALAERLETANRERKVLDRQIEQEAVRQAERHMSARLRHGLVVHQPDWHPGVVGIVASRIVERFYRPAVVLCTVNGIVKGSARSIKGVNVYEAIKACEDVLIGFGGHDFAAGLSLEEAALPAFQAGFDEAVGRQITPEVLQPAIDVDAPVRVDEVGGRFWAVLRQFAPFGPSNDQPVFLASDLEVAGEPRRLGRDGTHLKFRVRQRGGHAGTDRDVIGFNMPTHYDTVLDSRRRGLPLELLFSVEENTWNGTTTLQLKARDLRLQNGTSP